MNFSNAILKNISKQIETGRALTAIATANQYLKKDCPIRMALVKKARNQLKSYSPEVLCILAGDRVKDAVLSGAIRENSEYAGLEKKALTIPLSFEFQIYRTQTFRRSSPARILIKRIRQTIKAKTLKNCR